MAPLLQILDLSDCQLDDEALIRIMPVFGHLEELYLSDNTFTWYGIRSEYLSDNTFTCYGIR